MIVMALMKWLEFFMFWSNKLAPLRQHRSHYANRTFYYYFFFLYSEEIYISGPRVKFVQWKAFTPPVVYTTDRSKAVVPMLFLFCVAL